MNAAFDRADATDTRTDDHSAAFAILFRKVDAGMSYGLGRGGDGELAKAIHPLDVTEIHDGGGVPPFNLASDCNSPIGVGGELFTLNLADAAATLAHGVPRRVGSGAQICERSKSGDYDPGNAARVACAVQDQILLLNKRNSWRRSLAASKSASYAPGWAFLMKEIASPTVLIFSA